MNIRKHLLPHKDNNYHPHLFRASGVVVSIMALLGFFSVSSKIITSLPKSSSYAAVYAGTVVAYTNDNRQTNGETTLTSSPALTEAAQLKADDMAAKGYFAHTSPDGKAPWYWFNKVGYDYEYAGENLAIDYSDSKDVTDAWMASPTHRANILYSDFKEVGVATAVGMYQGKETTFVVQEFGTPDNAPITPKPVSRPTGRPSTVVKASTTAQDAALVPTTTEGRVAGAYSAKPTVIDHIVAAPRKSLVSLYYIFIAIIAGLMLLGAIVEFKRHHKAIWLAGGILIVAAAGLAYLLLQFGQGSI